jgi:hypothetical protein
MVEPAAPISTENPSSEATDVTVAEDASLDIEEYVPAPESLTVAAEDWIPMDHKSDQLA